MGQYLHRIYADLAYFVILKSSNNPNYPLRDTNNSQMNSQMFNYATYGYIKLARVSIGGST